MVQGSHIDLSTEIDLREDLRDDALGHPQSAIAVVARFRLPVIAMSQAERPDDARAPQTVL